MTAVPGMSEPRKGLVERLFAEHRSALQAFFYRRIRTKSDAPDLAQEVYVRMLRVSDEQAIRNPERYLYTVASNLVKEYAVLDRWRAQQRGPRRGEHPATAGRVADIRWATRRCAACRALAHGAWATLSQVSSRSHTSISPWPELPGDRRASQRVAAHGEEVPGAGAGSLPASNGADGVMS